MGVEDAVRDAMSGEDMQSQIDAFVKTVTGEQPEGQDPTEEPEAAPVSSEGEGPAETRPDVREGEVPEVPDPVGTESEDTGDIPTSYMGIDLSDIPPEKRRDVLTAFKEQDRFLNRILQRNADLEKQVEMQERPDLRSVEEEPPMPKQLSNEDIMAALGYDQDDPMYDVKSEVALPLAKQLLDMRAQVDTLVEEREVEKAATYWNETLDTLEGEYGELPITRDQLLDFAIENRVFDPVSAYHQVMGPLRKTFSDAASKARNEMLEELKKQQAGSVRPRTSGKTETKVVEGKDVKSAVREAARIAAEEAGLDWEEALQTFMSSS